MKDYFFTKTYQRKIEAAERRRKRSEKRLEKRAEKRYLDEERRERQYQRKQQARREERFEAARPTCKYCGKKYDHSHVRAHCEYCCKKCMVSDLGSAEAEKYIRNIKQIFSEKLDLLIKAHKANEALVWSLGMQDFTRSQAIFLAILYYDEVLSPIYNPHKAEELLINVLDNASVKEKCELVTSESFFYTGGIAAKVVESVSAQDLANYCNFSGLICLTWAANRARDYTSRISLNAMLINAMFTHANGTTALKNNALTKFHDMPLSYSIKLISEIFNKLPYDKKFADTLYETIKTLDDRDLERWLEYCDNNILRSMIINEQTARENIIRQAKKEKIYSALRHITAGLILWLILWLILCFLFEFNGCSVLGWLAFLLAAAMTFGVYHWKYYGRYYWDNH